MPRLTWIPTWQSANCPGHVFVSPNHRGRASANHYNNGCDDGVRPLFPPPRFEMVHPIDPRFPVPPRVPPAQSGADSLADGLLPLLDMQSRDPLPNLPTSRAMSLLLDDDVAATTWEEDVRVPPDEAGMFWLNGDVLMCSCPDCGAPMTVRLWLMLADCWQCEACIELTAAQQHEARRVLERHQIHPQVVPAAGSATVAAAVRASDAVSTALDDPRLRPAIRRLRRRSASRTSRTSHWHHRAARRRDARVRGQAAVKPTRCRSGSTRLSRTCPPG